MISVRESKSTEPLAELKRLYVRQATAPLDGMWLCGFVPMATHYGFYSEDTRVGFCCVNDEGYLLQFYLTSEYQNEASRLFELIVRSDRSTAPTIKGAFVSTAEPRFLSLCLDTFSAFEVNALMYQHEPASGGQSEDASGVLAAIDSTHLKQAVEFAKESIGAPEDWLTGYYTNLIKRRELFGLWDNDRLIATGESRGYDDYQTDYADVGVIVAKTERGKGLATSVLKQLVVMNEKKGLKSICSTEKSNVAAQKAITRAGFFASNRIVRFYD